ncbi:MAG TPA: cyanophycinase, partial [Candidatus Tumulicola sp.]|nr:cyanophycinase [Candidatus Tumulicola sp.]
MLASLFGASRARAAITVYPRVGNQADSAITPQGPGLVIMGGGSDVDGAFVWMHDTVVGAKSTSGADVVILRATGDNAYDSYIAGLAPFNSVQTLLIPTPASASDLSTAAAIVDKAEVVFFAGGNQADYVGWKGSPLLTAVAGCHQRGGVVGGTSAGAAILGQFVFDAVAAGSSNVATADAVANPYESTISFTHDLLPFAILDDAITDPHFVVRDRMGRLTVFMARQLADGLASGTTHGIGVDEGTAVCIDKHGLGVIMQYTAGTGSAFVVSGGAAATIQAGTPLRYPALTVTRLDQQGQTYDFSHWCGTTTTYALSVDGTAMPPYSPA